MRRLVEYEQFGARPLNPDEAEFAEDLDFAYFAVRLGWSLSQYLEITETQRLLIRKEIERKTVAETELMRQAVAVAVHNEFSKRRVKLWPSKKAAPRDESITDNEIAALKEAYKAKAPWTPWQEAG